MQSFCLEKGDGIDADTLLWSGLSFGETVTVSGRTIISLGDTPIRSPLNKGIHLETARGRLADLEGIKVRPPSTSQLYVPTTKQREVLADMKIVDEFVGWNYLEN